MPETINCSIVDILANKECYRSLVINSAHFLLDTPLKPNSQVVAIEARLGDQLIGLIVVQVFPQLTAQLYSFFVVENYRNRGVGTFLFRTMQNYLKEHDHCRAFGFEYDKLLPSGPYVEKILSHLGWNPPKVYLIRCYFDVKAFQAPWYISCIHKQKPKGLKMFSWDHLKKEEHEMILHEAEQGRFLSYLSPFHEKDKKIESLNTMGLRFNNRLIGWCVTHRKDENTLNYSSLYVKKEWQLAGFGVWLLSQAIKIQQSSSIPHALFEVNTEEVDLSWWNFVKKRLIPFAQKVEKVKWALYVNN